MSALTDLEALISRTLHDTGNAIFAVADIDRAILQALEDYSRRSPLQQSTNKATTSGSRDITLDAATFPDLIEVIDVEYPLGGYPQTRPPFERWGTTLTLHSNNLPDGSNARIMWTKIHTVATATTVPVHHTDIIVAGAAGYACTNIEAELTNQLNSDPKAVEHYRTLADQYLARFQKALDRITRNLKPHQLTTQVAPKNTKTTDFGP